MHFALENIESKEAKCFFLSAFLKFSCSYLLFTTCFVDGIQLDLVKDSTKPKTPSRAPHDDDVSLLAHSIDLCLATDEMEGGREGVGVPVFSMSKGIIIFVTYVSM